MKRIMIFLLAFAMLFMPVLTFAATEIEALNSLPGSHSLLKLTGGACLRWEQQCKEDPFDPGKQECTQRCLQYDNTDNSGNNPSGGGFEMDPLKALLGLVIVCALLYWALTSAG